MPRMLSWLWVGCALFCVSLLLAPSSASAEDWGGGWGDEATTDPTPDVVEVEDEVVEEPIPDAPAPAPAEEPVADEDAWGAPAEAKEPVAPVAEDDPEAAQTETEVDEAAPVSDPVEEEPIADAPPPATPADPETDADSDNTGEEGTDAADSADESGESDATTDEDEVDDEDELLTPPESMQQLDEEVRDDVRTIMLTHDHALRTQARDDMIAMGVEGIPGAMMLVQDKMQLSRIFGVGILREIAVNAGGQGVAGQIPGYLLSLLTDHDPMVRHQASMALRKITRQHFDYHFNAPESQRTQAIGRWHRYLLDQGMIKVGD